MIKKPVIGISGCLAGSAVRFDGGLDLPLYFQTPVIT